MIGKPLDQIVKADIENLVMASVSEGRMLDYKEALPGSSDSDKREFLSDVSSFANASGGDLIYGIKEKRDADNKPTGEPEMACGLTQINADQEIQRLENMLRDGLDPRIAGIHMRAIEGFSQGPAAIIRIPKSWNSPHMVKTSSRFYSRNSRGKYPLDVTEIRAAFILSESLPEKIRRFRDDRLSKIIADETPFPLRPGAKTALHILPVVAFGATSLIDIPSSTGAGLCPLRVSEPHHAQARYNFDGLLQYIPPGNGKRGYTYAQLFRGGAIETVETSMLSTRLATKKQIPSVGLEKEIIKGVQNALATERHLGVQPPFFIVVTLLGVTGYTLERQSFFPTDSIPIDRDILLLPEVVIEDWNVDVGRALRPIFDTLWQTAGCPGSPNYDQGGHWKAHA